jgi:hypothetical protein
MAGASPKPTDPAAPPPRRAGLPALPLAGLLPGGAAGIFVVLAVIVVLWVLAGLAWGYAGVILPALGATLLVFVYLMLIAVD